MKVTVLVDRDIAKSAAGPVVSCKKGDEIDVSDSQAEYLHGKGIVKMDGHRAVKAKAKRKKTAPKKDADDGDTAED